MTTVASPVSIREQAMEVITTIIGPSDSSRRLVEAGGAVVADLLFKLEQRFDIGLEVDEVLPNGTVAVLLNLVELRALAAEAAAKAGKVYHWDDERARRGRPLAIKRPRLAEVIREAQDEPANLAPPAWPSTYPEPRRRIEIAVPSEAAWASAARLHARERARRAQLLVATLICAMLGVAAFAVWLAGSGLV